MPKQHTIDIDDARDAFVDTIRGDVTKVDYLERAAQAQVEKVERETYQRWFRDLGIDGMKAIYDANQ